MSPASDSGIEASTIEGVRSSTRFLLNSFKEKTDELEQSGSDIELLLRFGVDAKSACSTAKEFFGKDRVEYIAIDGTNSMDQQLDLLVFYVGGFGYSGTLSFQEEGSIRVGVPHAVDQTFAVSTAIPLSEEDAAAVFGQRTESGVEVDAERLPEAIMHLAEYYIAYKAIRSNDSLKVILLDRTLAGDVAHLVWSTHDLIHDHLSILEGMNNTSFGPVTNFDLETARLLVDDQALKIPAARSQLLKYAAVSHLFNGQELSLSQLIGRLGANQNRLTKLQEDFGELESEFHVFDKSLDSFRLRPEVKDYWKRVLGAAVQVADHVFDPESEHPLRFKKGDQDYWITADDLDYLVLVFIYELTRLSWSDNILPIGFIKDTGASELVRTVVPLLQASGLLALNYRFPNFNSDKMLLQTNSVINASTVPTPWHTIDIDAAFRTMAPVEDQTLQAGEARVRGAYGNVIYPERMYVKTYMQLWSSTSDPSVRSHVFTFDRPAYASYDHWDELLLHNEDNGFEEKIRPVLNFKEGSKMTNLAMSLLVQMAGEVIPEALGHNYPLFLADKKAKFILKQSREACLGAVAIEMARSDLDQQVLFSRRFRDYRSDVESKRRR